MLEIFIFQIKKAGLIQEELFRRELNLCKSSLTFPQVPVLRPVMAYKQFREGFFKGNNSGFLHSYLFIFDWIGKGNLYFPFVFVSG